MSSLHLAVRIWARAQGVYLLFNLPALLAPIFFIYSESLAIICGVPAGILFIPVVGIIRRIKAFGHDVAAAVGVGALLLCFAATWWAAYIMSGPDPSAAEVWKEYRDWILFPSAALLATTISVAVEWKRMAAPANKATSLIVPAV